MIIDAHTHIYPDAVAPAVVQKLSVPTGLRPSADGTADGLRAQMRRAGVDRSIVLPVATNPAKVGHLNDFAIRLNGADGLYSFGAVHPDCPGWRSELRRVQAAGLRGIKVHPIYQGVDFDDPRFLRIFAEAASLGLIVVTHAGYDIGFPGADRSAPRRIRAALKAVGEFPLILAHMGGWRCWDEVPELLADTTALLDTSFSLCPSDTANDEHQWLSDEAFVRLIRTFSAERILFGTDSPWTDPQTELRHIRALPLSDKEKAAILGGNAKRLLRI